MPFDINVSFNYSKGKKGQRNYKLWLITGTSCELKKEMYQWDWEILYEYFGNILAIEQPLLKKKNRAVKDDTVKIKNNFYPMQYINWKKR